MPWRNIDNGVNDRTTFADAARSGFVVLGDVVFQE
jgi:hypothetical protein